MKYLTSLFYELQEHPIVFIIAVGFIIIGIIYFAK